jgi:hypothetical protein
VKELQSAGGIVLRKPAEFTREQIRDAILDVFKVTDQGRCTPLTVKFLVVFRERHGDLEIHFHVGVLAERNFRFNVLKKALLEKYGLASHWATSHEYYSSVVAYGYVPSLRKKQEDLDTAPSSPPPPPATPLSRPPPP